MSFIKSKTSVLIEETDLLKKLESLQLKKQLESLSTFLPNLILTPPANDITKQRPTVLLSIEVSGITSLCERYNRKGCGGTNQLTATLNAYVGSIIEVVQFYGGDLLKFTGDEFLIMWSIMGDLKDSIHNVIVCSQLIQSVFGCYDTEVNIPLRLKISICYGYVRFFIIEAINKDYILLGSAIDDVKLARSASLSGDVVVSEFTWRHLNAERYEFLKTGLGFYKIWRCTRGSREDGFVEECVEKQNIIKQLCMKHMEYRNALHKQRSFDDTTTDVEITENFIRSVPQRAAIKLAAKHWQIYNIKPFVAKLIQKQIDDKQPIDHLNEIREVTIQYVSINFTQLNCRDLSRTVECVYKIIEDIVNNSLGVIISLSLLEKDATITVAFGVHGAKCEMESQTALVSAFKIHQYVSEVDAVKSVSIGVANGFVYSGVIGHPFRKEFILVGKVVNRAARFTCSFPNKVICDHKSYRNSKLPSYYFQLQFSPDIKGIEDEHLFEYNENFRCQATSSDITLVGRSEESDLICSIINHAEKINYYGVCFHGSEKIGKSKLIQSSFLACQEGGYVIASIELCKYAQRPYFCVSNLYKQLYNSRCALNKEEFVFVKNLPADLWDFSEILQTCSQSKNNLLHVQRKLKILNLFSEITKNCKYGVAVLYIDNIQYIDTHSLDILETIIKDKCIRLICTGQFEEDFWNIRWKISLNNYIKLLELGPLKSEHVADFACNFLQVSGIPNRFKTILEDTCGGIPGLMEKFTQHLIHQGHLQLAYMSKQSDFTGFFLIKKSNVELNFLTRIEHSKNLLMCTFSDDYELKGNLSLTSITMNLLDTYSTFQLYLLKTCSVLGNIFTRSLLTSVAKYPSEYIFANSIKSLYLQDIFECGSKYLAPAGIITDNLHCTCIIDEDERKRNKSISKFPKYAFCKVLHFKHKIIRDMVYNLLESSERRDLHIKITEVLELQNNLCGNCVKNNAAPIVTIPKFNDVLYMCNEAQNENSVANKGYVASESNNIENVLNVHFRNSNLTKGKRKIWDSTICSCLENLIKAYEDLVHHSRESGHVGKLIYFLVQEGFIMMLMNEFDAAISLLTEVNRVCNNITIHYELTISDMFKNIHLAKSNLLLAQTYMNLGDTSEAKRYLLVSLKQYEITVLSTNISDTFFSMNLFAKLIPEGTRIRLKNSMIENDFGTCLNSVSNLFALEGDLKMAKIASDQCITFLNSQVADVNVLCDVYANAICICNYYGDEKTCEILENYVSHYILKKFNSNVTYELFSICKLIYTIFQVRFMNAQLETAIRLGYRALDLNNTIQAYRIQIGVVAILSTILLMVKRIEDSVEVAKIVYTIGKTRDEVALLVYYTYCLELILETSFFLEPVERILTYAENYFIVINRTEYTVIEKSLLIYLYNYYLRSNRWGEVTKWKKLLQFTEFPCNCVQSAKNLFKYSESVMISFNRHEKSKRQGAHAESMIMKNYLKDCKIIANKWKIFKPRYLHYKAYYHKILRRRNKEKICLKRALHFADEQGNLLEHCWLVQSRNSWDGGFNFEGDRKYVEWKLAKSYSHIHWSQILYGLPLHP